MAKKKKVSKKVEDASKLAISRAFIFESLETIEIFLNSILDANVETETLTEAEFEFLDAHHSELYKFIQSRKE